MNKYDYKKICPFKWYILENFPFIEADFDAITNYQLYCKVVEYLNKVIADMNSVGEQTENLTNAFIELQNYVNNYFDNLDVQDEINNKLDEMAESGELLTLFTNYVPVVSVEMYGAVGDGETDDTTAINSAVNSGAKIILFSHDEYLVSDRIEIIEKSNMSILGNGATLIVDESVAESETPNYDKYLVKGYKCNNINVQDLNVNGSKTFYYRTDDTTGTYAENTALYLAHRSTGYSGIGFESSDNITIKNCKAHHVCSGIGFKNSTNSIIDNCDVEYTMTDAFPLYHGCKNITVQNCYCYNNGDDAFPVYSLKKYWNYENTEVDVDQCENIHFINNRSVNNRSRGLINVGGKNIFYNNCVFDNVNWCFMIGSPSNDLYDTINTIIENVIFNTSPQYGITSSYRATVKKANDVFIRNSIIKCIDALSAQQQFRVGTDTNLYINDTKINDIKFVNIDNTSQKIKFVNVDVHSTSYSEFDITNLEIENCIFKNDGNGNQGIYLRNCVNLIAKNVTLDNNKYLIGTITNIITDNIHNFYSGSLTGVNIKITSPIMTNSAITAGNFENGSVQIVKGIPRYYDNNQWNIPLFLPVSNVVSSGSCNDLYGINGVKVQIVTANVTNKPTDNDLYFIVTIESSGANQKSQIALSLTNTSLLYTRNGTGSWVAHQ